MLAKWEVELFKAEVDAARTDKRRKLYVYSARTYN